MAAISDLDVYRRLAGLAEELQALAEGGCSLVADTALRTAALNLHGMAQVVYEHGVQAAGDQRDS